MSNKYIYSVCFRKYITFLPFRLVFKLKERPIDFHRQFVVPIKSSIANTAVDAVNLSNGMG